MTYGGDYTAAPEPTEGEAMPDGQAPSLTVMDMPGQQNIAEMLDKQLLTDIGTRVYDEYKIDCDSRSDLVESWDRAAKAFSLKKEPKHYPFANAANVKYPTLLNAAIQFAARAMPAIVHNGKVAKGKIVGEEIPDPPPELLGQLPPQALEIIAANRKQAKADRVANYLNWQTLDRKSQWVEETDRLLHQLPVYGNSFKKIWQGPDGVRSDMVSPYQFVVNACYPDLDVAPRWSHIFDLYPYQVEERKRQGLYRDLDYQGSYEEEDKGEYKKQDYDSRDPSSPQCFIEQFRREDLDDDGYAEPYLVTLHLGSRQIARIVAAYDRQDIRVGQDGRVTAIAKRPNPTFVKYGFVPDPAGGFYDLGFGFLLNDLSESIDTLINQILDSGNLANSPMGFVGKEFRLKAGEFRVKPGMFQQATVGGNDIRTAIYQMVFPQPSPVLFQMLQFLMEAADKVTNNAEVLTGEAPANQPATATLALIEQGLKVFTGVVGRILRSLGEELNAFYEMNARAVDVEGVKYQAVGDSPAYVLQTDFDPESCDVVPVADASVVTDMQKAARAQVAMQTFLTPAGQATMDPLAVASMTLEAAGIEAATLMRKPAQPDPMQQMAQQVELKKTDAEGNLANAEAERAHAQARTEQLKPVMKMLDHAASIHQAEIAAAARPDGEGKGKNGAGDNGKAVRGMASEPDYGHVLENLGGLLTGNGADLGGQGPGELPPGQGPGFPG